MGNARLTLCALLALLPLAARGEDAVLGIPLKPDPPFAIDGDLADWAKVPGGLTYDRKEQVVYGPATWTGPADLSARIQLAWRSDGLYVAADVTDDQVRQSFRGDGLWKGDHLEVYLDLQPDLEPQRREFGLGQAMVALSPGNFQHTGDATVDNPPEAYVFRPTGVSPDGIRVAARRTDAGYTIEGLIPWSKLGVTDAAAGRRLRVEVGVSDTDGPDGKQEALVTSSTANWEHSRPRLTEACLAGSDGVPHPAPTRFPIGPGRTLQTGGKDSLTFTAPTVPPGKRAILAFQARLDFPKVAGHNPALRVLVNDRAVPGEKLVNKPLKAPSRGGAVYTLYAGEVLVVYYSPDFRAPDSDAYYGLVDSSLHPADYQLDVTDFLKPGTNTLTLLDVAKTDKPLVIGDLSLELQAPPPPPKPKAGPPTGPIPVSEPAARHQVDYALAELPDGVLKLTVGGQAFTVATRYSTPAPAWATGENRYFALQRTVDKRPEAVVVRETFTNRTDENLGLIQRHEVAEAAEQVWLAGLPRPGGRGTVQEPQNPTAYGTRGTVGCGLLALSDVLTVHSTVYADGGKVGLADNSLVIPPRGTVTAEWAILPTAAADPFAFVNAARRLLGANFAIDGGFCFFRTDKNTAPWTDEQTRNFLLFKSVKYAASTIPSLRGVYAHGTPFLEVDPKPYREAFARRKRLVPGIANLMYFHCFLDVSPDGPTKWPDARILRPDGTQADYGEPPYKLYLPLENNAYGTADAKLIDHILDDLGADGVYWDEHEYSAYQYHYGQPWDQVSGDLNATTMKIDRLKSSVTLLTEPWRLKQAKRILARGPLIGNGSPVTAAMRALKFPCFHETGSITNCAQALLYSPLALGDHLTERSERDAYRVMLEALNYGCLYHWYNDLNVLPTHPTLTQYMFPITPVELHAGTVIGTDRIVTRASGLHGFGDASAHEVHVYNDQGVEVPEFKAPTITRDGKTYTELRLAEDWSAVILRKR